MPIDAARETYRLLQSHGVNVELVEMPGEARTVYQTYVASMDDLGVSRTGWDDIAR